MNTYYLNWQDPESRRWYAVGKLQQFDDMYLFSYTKGASISPRFMPFGNMSNMNAVYVSEELFPIFANRVMSEKRPEFIKYAQWSDLDYERKADPLYLMARMGGVRATDTLQVYPVPKKTSDGYYKTAFFCHGISHLSESSQSRAMMLDAGSQLYPMLDVQNPYDDNAVSLRASDPATMLGYVPRYLAKDVIKLLEAKPSWLSMSVRKVNRDAPSQFRLLCDIICPWPSGFIPCDDADHETIVNFDPLMLRDHIRYQHLSEQGMLR